MDYGLYRYDEPYARPVRRRINYFAWTVAILLLTGFAFAAWLGSFYIFSQPERPDSYRILQKLHKIEPTKRFELTAAPPGEFLSAKQLYDRYNAMGSAEFAKTNLEAGWPLFKEQARLRAEMHFTQFKEGRGQPQTPTQVAIPGFAPSGTPPPAENQLIRVEPAKPVETPAIVQVGKKGKPGAKPTPTPKGKLAKGKPTPKASASASPIVLAEKSNYSPPPTSTSSIAQASPSLAPQKSPAAKVPA